MGILSFSDVGIEKFMKRLIGRTDVENALQRLDRLTQEETRTTVAENLAVTYNIKDGTSRFTQLLIYANNVSRHAVNSRREVNLFVHYNAITIPY
jgi:uncharacterized protein HemY